MIISDKYSTEFLPEANATRQRPGRSTLLPAGPAFASLGEARLEMTHYLDPYNTRDHRYFALGYRAPHQFEQDLKTNPP